VSDTDDTPDVAGEYVLGTLPEAEADTVGARLPDDRDLASAVYAWQDKLLPLTTRTTPTRPSPSLWRRIERQLDASAPRPTRQRTQDPAPPWWRRLGVWQGLSAAAVAASMALGVLLVQRTAVPEAPRYLAVLQSPDEGRTGWVVEMQAGGRLRLVPVGDGAATPAGRALQFWTKPEGAAGPTSLGLVQAGQTVELPVSQLPAVEAQQLFEITLEPEGGSPIGRPTGPILVVGRTVRL